jgi:hypothetical protein
MRRWMAVVITAGGLAGGNAAYAQEVSPGPGQVEVTIIPGGATFFTEGKETKETSFGNYDLGLAGAVNFNRYIGVEGEVSGALGITQDLQRGALTSNLKTPTAIDYSGNVVVSVPTGSSVTPYAAGGIGGLTFLERASVGIDKTETFLTGNVGAGLKWYAGRWGVRGDYRLVAVRSRDDAPAFFGNETRFGHRVYGGVVIDVHR